MFALAQVGEGVPGGVWHREGQHEWSPDVLEEKPMEAERGLPVCSGAVLCEADAHGAIGEPTGSVAPAERPFALADERTTGSDQPRACTREALGWSSDTVALRVPAE